MWEEIETSFSPVQNNVLLSQLNVFSSYKYQEEKILKCINAHSIIILNSKEEIFMERLKLKRL